MINKNHSVQRCEWSGLEFFDPCPGNTQVPSNISAHVWNEERDQVAVTKANKDVEIYKVSSNNGSLYKTSVLDQHDLRVTGMDWAPKTNRIVTCSADRNAYVWNLDKNGKDWSHSLVLLRINRAATCVRWSPSENKFAVGSASKIISICYFEPENNWWIAKHIKKGLHSTVTALSWHPDNWTLATGTSGFKVRIFSAFIKEIDVSKPKENIWCPKQNKFPFQHLIAEFANSPQGGGWIHSVEFCPKSGSKLAWVAHNSSVSVAFAPQPLINDHSSSTNAIAPLVCQIKLSFLPFTNLIWLNSSIFLASGHESSPFIFEVSENDQCTLNVKGRLELNKSSTTTHCCKPYFQQIRSQSSPTSTSDGNPEGEGNGKPPKPAILPKSSSIAVQTRDFKAKAIFQSKDRTNEDIGGFREDSSETDNSEKSDSNCSIDSISDLKLVLNDPPVLVVSTSSRDGKIILWDVKNNF